VLALAVVAVAIFAVAIEPGRAPKILRISPTGGPEGTPVHIAGENLDGSSAVLFGTSSAVFKPTSPEEIVAIVPHNTATAILTVVTPRGRAASPFVFAIFNDSRIPDEVGFKAGYINVVAPWFEPRSAMLWGIAIADTRVAGYESAEVEVASTQLSCRFEGRDVVLNDDNGNVHGGLYLRQPWFSGNQPEFMPLLYDRQNHAVVLRVGQRADRVWHFWSASHRVSFPAGDREGCTVKARVKISPGALFQMGMDYWRDSIAVFGLGGNNREAGASNWYFPSDQWQEAVFSDIGGPTF